MCFGLFRQREKPFPREYTDLINKATGKWPNWYPPMVVRAGDFGSLDEESGELWADGNIYTHEDTMQLAGQFPSVQEPEIDDYKIHSHDVQELDVGPEPGAVKDLIFQSWWQFNKKRGAVLLMHRPRRTYIPDEFFEVSRGVRILKGKFVVTETWDCPGYFWYLSSKMNEQMTVGLHEGKITVPARDLSGGDGGRSCLTAHSPWFYQGAIGYFKYSYLANGLYTPLLSLKLVPKVPKSWLRRLKSRLRRGW
ncbi:hypothetical protein BC826DRAFT_1110231 [Russula brevipes]|nr:hypothetical protein BC826DRAFT_1110231 [Russula brevipes]